jgi:hypothetical protein
LNKGAPSKPLPDTAALEQMLRSRSQLGQVMTYVLKKPRVKIHYMASRDRADPGNPIYFLEIYCSWPKHRFSLSTFGAVLYFDSDLKLYQYNLR